MAAGIRPTERRSVAIKNVFDLLPKQANNRNRCDRHYCQNDQILRHGDALTAADLMAKNFQGEFFLLSKEFMFSVLAAAVEADPVMVEALCPPASVPPKVEVLR